MNIDALYVDDDPANLLVFEAAFGREFRVATVDGGEKALEFLANHEVSVLLSDQRMPGLTGVELLTLARQRHPDTERFLVTAYSNLDEAIEAVNKGHIRRYLRKPWQAQEVRQAIREGIETRTLRQRVCALERRALASERTYALGVVAAGIGHELRNPLGSMLLQSELALDEAHRSGAGPALLSRLTGIHNTALRVREILEGMTLAHRRSVGGSVDLGEVVRLTLSALQGTLRTRAHLQTELAALPPVCGTSTTLGQVVLNLLVNAMQAIPEDEPEGLHRIEVRLYAQGEVGVLEVEDTGRGIPEDLRSKLFEPFFSTKEDGGTGLGLAISRRIVEEQGGSIQALPGSDRGSLFRVTLPFAKP